MSDTIIGSVIGLFGVIIGWVLNRLTVAHTIKKQELYKAAAAFRVAFTDEIRTLRSAVHPETKEDSFVQSLLTEALVKHENAYIIFRSYLSHKKQYKFDVVWRSFCCPEGGSIEEQPSLFIDYLIETRLDESIKLALEKIEKLVEFAKPR